MQRLAYFKVCEVRERGTLNLRQLLATRYPPSSTIYPMAASENCARWARGWIMVLVELKFSTLGVFKFDHGPRRCGPNMPFDRRCVCFPLRWRVVEGFCRLKAWFFVQIRPHRRESGRCAGHPAGRSTSMGRGAGWQGALGVAKMDGSQKSESALRRTGCNA